MPLSKQTIPNYDNLLVYPSGLDDKSYWARKQGDRKETLLEHSKNTINFFYNFCAVKNVDRVILNTIKEITADKRQQEWIFKLFVNAIFLHDIGKINTQYQAQVLKNPGFKKNNFQSAYHSPVSADIYFNHFFNNKEFQESSDVVLKVLAAFTYCISKHHGNLQNYQLNFSDSQYSTSSYTPDQLNNLTNIIIEEQGGEFAFYILTKLLFSLIVLCDYCATQQFMTGDIVQLNVIENTDEFFSKYTKSCLYKKIQRQKNKKLNLKTASMNQLRTSIFLTTEKAINSSNANIFYLEAPTGSGKTNTSINLAYQLLKKHQQLNSVFYIFPFNTLIEQTKKTLNRYFKNSFSVVNSVTGLQQTNSENKSDDLVWMDHLINNYKMVVTSHVNFFNILFGSGRNDGFPLLKLINSVVIIDEIQCYKNTIWKEIIHLLSHYSKLLNIKIIIMSATLPRLDLLIDDEQSKFESLLPNAAEYFTNDKFKNRVQLDFSLLNDDGFSLDKLKDYIVKYQNKKVLVEFIKKKSAKEFYHLCMQDDSLKGKVEILTGDDNKYRRNNVLSKIESANSIILITTQIIEAGVDIDMDVGFKDISIFDSEEQFMGRINRSCKKSDAIAYFFNHDSPSTIYKNDARLGFSLLEPAVQQCLKDKDFRQLYKRVLQEINKNKSKSNADNFHNFKRQCGTLKFSTIEDKMKLIEQQTEQVFIPYKINDKKLQLGGKEVWQKFVSIITSDSLSYSKRQIELKDVYEQMQHFTYQIYKPKNTHYQKLFGYYYIDNVDNLFDDNGVINTDKITAELSSIII